MGTTVNRDTSLEKYREFLFGSVQDKNYSKFTDKTFSFQGRFSSIFDLGVGPSPIHTRVLLPTTVLFGPDPWEGDRDDPSLLRSKSIDLLVTSSTSWWTHPSL